MPVQLKNEQTAVEKTKHAIELVKRTLSARHVGTVNGRTDTQGRHEAAQ